VTGRKPIPAFLQSIIDVIKEENPDVEVMPLSTSEFAELLNNPDGPLASDGCGNPDCPVCSNVATRDLEGSVAADILKEIRSQSKGKSPFEMNEEELQSLLVSMFRMAFRDMNQPMPSEEDSLLVLKEAGIEKLHHHTQALTGLKQRSESLGKEMDEAILLMKKEMKEIVNVAVDAMVAKQKAQSNPQTTPEQWDELRSEIIAWSWKNFDSSNGLGYVAQFLGLIEEYAGEYGEAKTREEQEDAIADFTIFFLNMVSTLGFHMSGLLPFNPALPDSMPVMLGRTAHTILKHWQGIRGLESKEKFLDSIHVNLSQMWHVWNRFLDKRRAPVNLFNLVHNVWLSVKGRDFSGRPPVEPFRGYVYTPKCLNTRPIIS
jgi:hypothetical protein